MRARSIVLPLLLAAFSSATVASAQTVIAPPPPPGTYAVSVALDDVLLPLLAAAEQDVAQGRPALALSRAQLVLEVAGQSSTLRVRADGVRLVAQQALAGATPEVQAPELVVEPLVASAEQDSQRGQHALAVARLDFAMQRVPAGSPLAQRALALRQVAMQLLSASAAQQAAPQVQQIGPTTQYGGTPYGGYAPAAPAAPIDAERPGATATPATPVDPTRRGDGEVIELYITSAIYGVYLGFWIPYAAGLESSGGSGSGSAENLVYSLAMLAGGGLMALGVAGLDSGSGLRTGVAPSMSMGIRYGLGLGFLMWGAADRALSPIGGRFDPTTGTFVESRDGMIERTAFPMAFGLGGLLIGATIGYGLNPSTNDVRFVETGGIWGSGLGLLAAIAAAQDSSQGFAITAAGLGTGLLTSAIIVGAGARVSSRRGWFMTLGFVIGAGAGTIVPALAAAATGEFSVQIFGAVAAATSIAGLITAFVLTEGMDAPRPAPEGARTERDDAPPIQIGLAPMEGGGLATLSGSF